MSTQDEMERIHHGVTGNTLQMIQLGLQMMEIAMAERSRQLARVTAERDAVARETTNAKLRADRELARAYWSRTRDRRWMEEADLVALADAYIKARGWAPYDQQAGEAMWRLERELADRGLDVTGLAPDRELTPDEQQMQAQLVVEKHEKDLAAQEDRVAEMLTEAWDAETVATLRQDEAWSALVGQVQTMEKQGVLEAVKRVDYKGFTADHIRNPAAFATWSLGNAVAGDQARTAGQGHRAYRGTSRRPPKRQPRRRPAARRDRETGRGED